MPMYTRYVSCIACDLEIDTENDMYAIDSCNCCARCYDCAIPGSHLENTSRRFEIDDRPPRRRNTELVRYYSYRPDPFLPKGNYPQEVLMGVELEVGGDKYDIGRIVKTVDDNEDHLYCKNDCSIYGAEIVTHPMTLKWAKEEFDFPLLLQRLRDNGCYSDNSECICGDSYGCDHEYGLHIHVSRNAFRQARKARRSNPEPIPVDESYEQRIGREMREMNRSLLRREREQRAINHQMVWLMFLERNSDKLAGEMKLCRRDPDHYGAFKKSSAEELRRKAQNGSYYDEGRYMAINCQGDKTYELRFFKSTIDTEEFFAALEFADASVEYTRQLDADRVLRNGGLQWGEFVKWVRSQERYPNLVAQCVKLNIED